MNQRFIYLDIDGVLNDGKPKSFHNDRDIMELSAGNFVLKSKLKLLLDFVRHTDSKIVIVSSWVMRHTISEIADFFGEPILGRISYCGSGLQRGTSLQEHIEKYTPHEYVIIDDAGKHCYNDMSHVVVTNGSIGLTPIDINKAKQILKIED